MGIRVRITLDSDSYGRNDETGELEDQEEEDRAWARLGLDQFFRDDAESDSIYDDPNVTETDNEQDSSPSRPIHDEPS